MRVSLEANPSLLIPGDKAAAFFAMVGREAPNGRLATINLPFDASSAGPDIRNHVLHEFCHVLGCLHEFQREVCVRDFDAGVIKRFYGLSDQAYDANFNALPTSHAWRPVASPRFDPKSVMMYRLKPDWFRSPSVCAVSVLATSLSSDDEAGLRQAYQFAGLSLRIEDFKKNAMSARLLESAQRALATSLRSTNARLQFQLKDIGQESFLEQSSRIETLARQADERAMGAAAKAESWELSPDQEKALRRVLSYFPS